MHQLTSLDLAPRMIVSASLYRMFLACLRRGRPARGTACLFLNPCKSRPGADTSCCRLDLTKRSSLLHMAKESHPLLKTKAIFRNRIELLILEIFFNFHPKSQTSWLEKKKKSSRLQGQCEPQVCVKRNLMKLLLVVLTEFCPGSTDALITIG